MYRESRVFGSKMKRIRFYLILVIVACVAYLSTFGWQRVKSSAFVYPGITEIIVENLKRHVYALSQEIGWRSAEHYDNLKQAASYIVSAFKKLGFKVESQRYWIKEKDVVNISVEVKGRKFPQKIILIGASYDAYFNPGADTNASGIAALIELAGFLMKDPIDYTVRLVAFTNKEYPFFGTEDMGSYRYLTDMESSGENIEAAIILDSLGYYSSGNFSQRYPVFFGFFYPDKANFIAAVSNLDSLPFLQNLSKVFRQN